MVQMLREMGSGTWFSGQEVVSLIGIALPKLHWVVQSVTSSCNACLFSHVMPGNLASTLYFDKILL